MRTLLVALLAASPSTFAAPVPKDSPDFTHSCTADLLARLPFVDADPTPKKDESSESAAGRSVSVAVHLSRAAFEEGDPVPALFVVKNRSDKPHGLWMEFDFLSGRAGGAGHIEVRNTKTETVSSPFPVRSTMCGGAHWDIPANGYWASRGNVGAIGPGESLPVGEYELTWTYAGTKSKAVPFTVVSRRLARPKPTPQRAIRVFRLEESGDESPASRKSVLNPVAPSGLTHALSTGVFGAYHPDVRDLPASSDGLCATVARKGDILAVTVDSPNREFGSLTCREPVVFLLLENGEAMTTDLPRKEQEARKAGDASGTNIRLPHTFNVPVSKDWKDQNGLAGDCRIAVVVASREPPERNFRIQEVMKAWDVKQDVSKAKVGDWVLRTEWLVLPKAGK